MPIKFLVSGEGWKGRVEVPILFFMGAGIFLIKDWFFGA